VFFNRNSTHKRVEQLEQDFVELKRAFEQVQQEWDATSTRVTKMLRRIRDEAVRLEENQVQETKSSFVERADATVPTAPGRLAKIQEQLALRPTNGGK